MAEDLDRYRNYGQRIEALIRPATFPLAVKRIASEAELLPKYKRPSRDMGVQNFVCQNFKMSRTYGWTIAVTEADINCKLARAVYGWDEMDKKWATNFNVGLYAKDAAGEKRFQQSLHVLDEAFSGLVISPLSRTKVVPDVVMVYCLPAQAMRFVQGYLFMEWGILGMIVGAALFAEAYPGLKKTVYTWGDLGKITLPQVLGVSHWVIIPLFVIGAVLLFRWFEKKGL